MGSRVIKLAVFAVAQMLLCAPCFAQQSTSIARSPAGSKTSSPEVLNLELRLIKDQLRTSPRDAQLHFQSGEILRKLGRTSEASGAYYRAGEIDAGMFVAFHQLSQTCTDQKMLENAIERLAKQAVQKPKELMLSVALSELLEAGGNYHEAARPLIEMTYSNSVPEKYKAKVSARIHFLLAQNQKAQKAEEQALTAATEEELDIVPSPLPAPASKRSIAAARIKDSREVKGVGKVPLLP